MFRNLKRALLGSPLASKEAHHQRLSKKRALAVFSSDALSSVAYATEAVLYVLMIGGTAALGLSIPISIAIIVLLGIVVFSYRQTLHQYPQGGGAYIVAKENLGTKASLLAGAALLLDYVLTVAVSITAGIEALTSAFPSMHSHSVSLCLVAILLITIANLRGIKESAAIFAAPTYFFVGCMFLMITTGLFRLASDGFPVTPPPELPMQHELTWFFVLRAFTAGCTAMTGVEAVSDGVPAFRYPEAKNASITLTVMAVILGCMFLGITTLAHFYGIVPVTHETVLSEIARTVFGRNWVYYIVQSSTVLILVLAANTAYADFPRLASFLARDRFLPRQLASLGDRLVFSNGVISLGVCASILVVIFRADTHGLLPLYAVGVFMSFTLSQMGMVRHWLKEKTGDWFKGVIINATGMVVTTIVFFIFILTRFLEGAWAVLLIVPLLMYMFTRIYRHYIDVGSQLTLIGNEVPENYMAPVKHTVILPISGIHRGILEAIRYAQSISSDVRAVYVEIDPSTTPRIQEEWKKWGRGLPLVVLKSPYRSVVTPLLRYIDEVEESMQDDLMTIIVPEFVPAKWWQQFLHNQTAIFMRAALVFRPGKVVTAVRYHLK